MCSVNPTRLLIALALSVLALSTIGCNIDVVEQQYRTQIQIPRPANGLHPIQETRWYKFDGDLNDVDSVRFTQASLMVLEPDERDLAFISNIRIYIDYEGELILFAQGQDFGANEPVGDLEIVYSGDLRQFVDKDNRIYITWVVMPNRWYRNWPQNGFSILADIRFELDINL